LNVPFELKFNNPYVQRNGHAKKEKGRWFDPAADPRKMISRFFGQERTSIEKAP